MVNSKRVVRKKKNCILNIPLNYKWYTQYRKLTKEEKKYKSVFLEVACSEIVES